MPRPLLALAVMLFCSTPALAGGPTAPLAPADFTLAPGLSVRLVTVTPGEIGDSLTAPQALGNGALLLADESSSPLGLTRINDDGSIYVIGEVRNIGYAYVTADPVSGCIWISAYIVGLQIQHWKIEGLPRTLSAGGCPNPPGDLAPGVEDTSTTPPTFRPTGDGRVNVADVVLLLRAAVGLTAIDCGP